MSSNNKYNLSEIDRRLPNRFDMYCFASFESRCYSIASKMNVSKVNKAFVFQNTNPECSSLIGENTAKLRGYFTNSSVLDVDLDQPMSLFNRIQNAISETIDSEIKNIVIDISTFTHEALLMMMHVLYNKKTVFDHVVLLYNGATKYADWLSKGCKDVRNVIGYPGFFTPAKKDHLIVLTGFEKERAIQLVESFEPEILSIGNGVDPTHENHKETMESIKCEFEDWYSNLGMKWSSFDFSCSDINSTVDTLKSLIDISKNTIIAPLNTKLSTIAVGLVALENSKIQVLYPIPEVYNSDYCEASDNCRIIELKDFTVFQ